MKLSLKELGARGDGQTLDTEFIQQGINQLAKAGGGTLHFDAGYTFLSGSILLKSGVELHLEKGSKLLASSDYADYSTEHSIPSITGGVVDETVLPQRAFISGYQAHGSSITGHGEICGNSDEFIAERGQYIHKMRGPVDGRSQYLERPFTIFLIDSQRVSLNEFTLTDPAFWAIRLTGCHDSSIQRIRILTDLMVPNADGIDIDCCQRVVIEDCELVTADDCISLKSCSGTVFYGDVADIKISGCQMVSTSGAITLGTESVGSIRDILVENCTVTRSHRGFAVRAREGGLISNVVFRNSSVETRAFSPDWWGHGEALHVTAFRWSEPDQLGDGNPERCLFGRVQGILFENINVVTEAGTLVWGQQPGLIQGVSFKNISQIMHKGSKWQPRIDLRPNDVQQLVTGPANAFEIVNADEVSFTNVEVDFQTDNSFFGEIFHIENSHIIGEITESRSASK